MATISSALAAGVIHEYALPAHEGRDSLRPLYGSNEFFDWVDQTDELDVKDWGPKSGGRSRYEHLVQSLCDFRCAVRPLVGDLNCAMPTKKGVWKIHANGVRIFGWVPHPHGFVAVFGALATQTHGAGSNANQLVSDVIEFAKKHGLHGTFHRGDRRALFPTSA